MALSKYIRTVPIMLGQCCWEQKFLPPGCYQGEARRGKGNESGGGGNFPSLKIQEASVFLASCGKKEHMPVVWTSFEKKKKKLTLLPPVP